MFRQRLMSLALIPESASDSLVRRDMGTLMR